MLDVVALGQLEDRLAGGLREPDHGAQLELGVHATSSSSHGVAIRVSSAAAAASQ